MSAGRRFSLSFGFYLWFRKVGGVFEIGKKSWDKRFAIAGKNASDERQARYCEWRWHLADVIAQSAQQ
jgi:hypothetical protein